MSIGEGRGTPSEEGVPLPSPNPTPLPPKTFVMGGVLTPGNGGKDIVERGSRHVWESRFLLFLPLHGLVKAGIGFLASLVRTEFVDVFW